MNWSNNSSRKFALLASRVGVVCWVGVAGCEGVASGVGFEGLGSEFIRTKFKRLSLSLVMWVWSI